MKPVVAIASKKKIYMLWSGHTPVTLSLREPILLQRDYGNYVRQDIQLGRAADFTFDGKAHLQLFASQGKGRSHQFL